MDPEPPCLASTLPCLAQGQVPKVVAAAKQACDQPPERPNGSCLSARGFGPPEMSEFCRLPGPNEIRELISLVPSQRGDHFGRKTCAPRGERGGSHDVYTNSYRAQAT